MSAPEERRRLCLCARRGQDPWCPEPGPGPCALAYPPAAPGQPRFGSPALLARPDVRVVDASELTPEMSICTAGDGHGPVWCSLDREAIDEYRALGYLNGPVAVRMPDQRATEMARRLCAALDLPATYAAEVTEPIARVLLTEGTTARKGGG